MSVKITNINGVSQNIPNRKNNNEKKSQTEFKSISEYKKAPVKVKLGVFLTTLAGVSIAMARTFKKMNYSTNLLKIFKSNIKEWSIFKIEYNKEKCELEHLVKRLAIGSVGGGLIGGILFDKKENRKAKYREAIIQLIGNIAIPILFISLGGRAFEKLESQGKIKFSSKNIKDFANFIVTSTSLVIGILLGNKTGNYITEKLFRVKDNRKIKLADMSPHLDDACLGATLVAPAESKIGTYLARIVPAALMIAGFSTGIAQENPERIIAKKATQNSSVQSPKMPEETKV